MFYKCWLGSVGTELNYTIAGSDYWCDIGRYFKKLRRKMAGKLKAILNTQAAFHHHVLNELVS